MPTWPGWGGIGRAGKPAPGLGTTAGRPGGIPGAPGWGANCSPGLCPGTIPIPAGAWRGAWLFTGGLGAEACDVGGVK
jgi:hypothetical protein